MSESKEMQVVSQQPGTIQSNQQWMAQPTIEGCPPGLEYLTQIDQLVCKQEVHLVEVFLNWEKNNKFHVFNSMGQKVYFVAEDSTCAQRQFCGNARGFTFNVMDNNNVKVLAFVRRFKCCAGCCCCANVDCCAFEVEVLTPTGETIGWVRQEKSSWKARISVQTADHEVIGTIKGPCCVCKSKCCGDIEFPLVANDGETVIGRIAKEWAGGAREFFTDADNFGVTFPMDMDVRAKATLLGATFLIDMMFFESNN